MKVFENEKYHRTAGLLILLALGIGLVYLIVVLVGNAAKSGENPSELPSDAVSCQVEDYRYPYLEEKLDEIGNDLKIDVVFVDEKLNVIGLKYNMKYLNEQRAEEALQMLTPELNLVLDRANVGNSFASDANLTRSGNTVMMNLYARKETLNEANGKFMLLEWDEGGLNKGEIIAQYEKHGLDCKAVSK